MTSPCPVCSSQLVKVTVQSDRYYYECPRCGSYTLSHEANMDLNRYLQKYEYASPKLSYVINRITKNQQWALLTSDLIENILKNTSMPTPQEQLNNFILWLGGKQSTPGEMARITDDTEAATGVVDTESMGFIMEHARERGLVSGAISRETGHYTFGLMQLTFSGWTYFYDLQHGSHATRQVFMAMKFGDEQLDSIYRDYFKPAVGATGFDLRRLDEDQPAGLIDDRLRVEIRQSRFLIADLTHHNKGAYWEAGFAEGLGKPVIYTCRRDAFENGEVHFDTNHHLTVIWEPDNLEAAIVRLKATIRATLPDEAKLEN